MYYVISITQQLHESLLNEVAGLLRRTMEEQNQELDGHMGKVVTTLQKS